MTTPTPGWGDTSGQNPYDPTHTSPSYDAGLGSPAGPGYTPSYDPGPGGPSYGTPSYDPEPVGYGAPDPFATPGYGQSPAYGQPQPYGEPMYAPQQPQPYAEPTYTPQQLQAYPMDNQYGYQAPAGYGLAPYTMMQTPLPTGMAVASMVCGIGGLVLGGCGFLLPVSIVAIVLGALTVQKANRGQAGGKGMAIAGIVTGSVGVAFSALMIILYVVGLLAGG